VGLSLVAILGVGACTPTDAEEGADEPTAAVDTTAFFTSVDPPDEPGPGHQIWNPTVVAPQGELPGLVVGTSAHEGDVAGIAVRSFTDDADSIVTVDTLPDGAVTGASVAADGDTTVIAGTAWDAGVTTPFVMTSPDRGGWDDVDVGDLTLDVPLTDVAVDGGTVIAVGSDDGIPGGLRYDGDTVTAVTFEAPPADVRWNIDDVDVADETVIVTGEVRTGGDDAAAVWVSSDGGASFGAPTLLEADGTSSTAGIVHDGDLWIATGVQKDPARTVAWSSSDGRTWSREKTSVPSSSGWTPWSESSDAVAGPPAAGTDGTVQMWASATNSLYGALWVRSSDGEWGTTPQRAAVSKDFYPGSSAALDISSDSTAVVVHARGSAQVARPTSDDFGQYLDLAAYSASPLYVDQGSSPDGPLLSVVRNELTVDGDDFERDGTLRQYQYGDTGFTPHDLGIDRSDFVQLAADPATGDEVAWYGADDGELHVEHRTQGGDWTEGTGSLYPHGSVDSVVAAGSGWYLTGSQIVDDGRRFVVKHSVDGVQWDDVEVPEAPDPTVPVMACALDDGSALVGGTVGVSGSTVSRMWHVGPETAEVVGDLPAGSRFGASCAGDSEATGTLLSGATASVWTSDGTGIEVVEGLDAFDRIAAVTSTDIGTVAIGELSADGAERPVLLLNTGDSWATVPVPAGEPPESMGVRATDDGLLVWVGESGRTLFYEVTDLDGLVAAAQPL
jgi:hypothetical protein